jgi:hypothetical protein
MNTRHLPAKQGVTPMMMLLPWRLSAAVALVTLGGRLCTGDVDAARAGPELLTVRDRGAARLICSTKGDPRFTCNGTIVASEHFVQKYRSIVRRIRQTDVRTAAWVTRNEAEPRAVFQLFTRSGITYCGSRPPSPLGQAPVRAVETLAPPPEAGDPAVAMLDERDDDDTLHGNRRRVSAEPPRLRASATERRRCAVGLTALDALREPSSEPGLWGGARSSAADHDFRPGRTRQRNPLVLRRMYLSPFAFGGDYRIESVSDGAPGPTHHLASSCKVTARALRSSRSAAEPCR